LRKKHPRGGGGDGNEILIGGERGMLDGEGRDFREQEEEIPETSGIQTKKKLGHAECGGEQIKPKGGGEKKREASLRGE